MTYTDYPEADIKTHREIGVVTIALGSLVTGMYAGKILAADASTLALLGIGLAGIVHGWAMHRIANEWAADLEEDA